MHGYDTYDIVWRQYYPAIMRFQTPDPEVENDYNLSPYTMCDNNMVMKVDPDGRIWWILVGLLMDSQPVNAPTNEMARNNQAMKESWDNYNKNIVADLIPLGPVNPGKVTAQVTLRQVEKKVEKEVVKEIHGNSKASTKPSGNYELKTENGKTYNGVGNEKRMNQSAKKIEKKYGDKVVEKTHTPAANKKEAYIKEHNDIKNNGGAGNKQKNYNQRNSPGKKIVEGGN